MVNIEHYSLQITFLCFGLFIFTKILNNMYVVIFSFLMKKIREITLYLNGAGPCTLWHFMCLCSPSCAKAGHFSLSHCCIFITLHNHQPVGAKKLIAENKLVIAVSITYQDIVIGTMDIQNEGKFLHSNSLQCIKKLQWKNNNRQGRERGRKKANRR